LQERLIGNHTQQLREGLIYQPTNMTIAYLRGRHLARPKKGVHPRSSAGLVPNDGRFSASLRHRQDGFHDVLSLNPRSVTNSRLLVANSGLQDRSSESGWGRDCADTRPCCAVPPYLLSDLRLSTAELQERYSTLGDTFRVQVTVFGVQQSLDVLQIRLCLADLGLAGFGAGVLRRKKTTVHLSLPRDVSVILAVHGVALISRALRKAYGWRCILHRSDEFCPPRDPRLIQRPLQQQQMPLRPPSCSTSCPQLSIGTWNVEGLNSACKQQEIGCMLLSRGLHIVAVQESHERVSSCIAVPGFRWFGRPRIGRSKGGVGFLVSLALVPEVQIVDSVLHPESVWLQLRGHRGQRELYLGCVYMPPVAANVEEKHYDALLDDVAGFQRRGQVMVLGDFNARVGSSTCAFDVIGQYGEDHCNPNGKRLIQLLHASDMYALNGRVRCPHPAWTRCRLSRGEQSIIDYVLADSDTLSSHPVLHVSPADVSDHYLVHVLLTHRATLHRPLPRRSRVRFRVERLRDDDVRLAYMSALQSHTASFATALAALQSLHAHDPARLTCLAVTEFETLLSRTANLVLGRKRCVQGRTVPWWTPELRTLIDGRRVAYRAARAAQISGSHLWPSLCDRWREARSLVKLRVRHHKRELRQEQMHTCNARLREGLAKDFWHTIRWRTAGTTPLIDIIRVSRARGADGRTVCSDQDITRVFAKHYRELGRPCVVHAASDFDDVHYRVVSERVLQYELLSREPRHSDDVLDAVFTVQEIETALKKLACHKAGTRDGLVNELLKYGGRALVDMFHRLVTVLWATESVPQQWRSGDIVNIFKKGDKADPGNYRGITLLNVVGKLYTKLLDTRLMSWLESHQRLHTCQAGFRRKRSCVDHIYSLSQIVQSRIRQGLPTFIFFRDAAKAFDTVWRDGLFAKLWDTGVRGKFWRLIRNLYASTQSRVLVNGHESDFFPIEQGVAQGDPLSPTLYAIFENELLETLHSGEDASVSFMAGILALMYADDLVVFATSASDLQEKGIQICYEHARKYRYRANVAKSGVMICGPATEQDHAHQFFWGVQQIPVVQEFMHLGVLVSADGSHDAHFQRGIKQGNARVAAMKPLFTDAYLTVRVKRLLLLTALRPCLEYASEVLVPTTTQSRALESVQLKAARMILGCPTLTGSEAVRGDLDLPLLSSRRDVAKLKWQHRLHALPASRFESILYSQEVPRGVRGRQRRLFGQVCDDIWSSLVSFSRDALTAPYPAFVTALVSAVEERDAAQLAGALSTKPRLGLYNRVTEGAGVKEYLCRHSDGHRATKIRFQFRSGTSMLTHHRADYLRAHADEEACPTCDRAEFVEDVPHVLFVCPAYAVLRSAFFASLRELVGGQQFDAFLALSPFEQAASFLRDDFMSGVPDQLHAVHRLGDTFLVDIVSLRTSLLPV
jgi:hypothetical protein